MATNTGATKHKKVDARIERSRALIIDAFERLVVEESYDKLTVSQIAREAQVDRKTFYQHFGSIEGVMMAIGDEVVVGILDEVELALQQHRINPTDTKSLVHTFFQAVSEAISGNILVNIALFEAIPNEALIAHLRAPLEREIFARNIIALDIPKEKLDYYFAFELGGILALYRTWMKESGDPFRLEEISDIATKLAMDGLSSILEIKNV